MFIFDWSKKKATEVKNTVVEIKSEVQNEVNAETEEHKLIDKLRLKLKVIYESDEAKKEGIEVQKVAAKMLDQLDVLLKNDTLRGAAKYFRQTRYNLVTEACDILETNRRVLEAGPNLGQRFLLACNEFIAAIASLFDISRPFQFAVRETVYHDNPKRNESFQYYKKGLFQVKSAMDDKIWEDRIKDIKEFIFR